MTTPNQPAKGQQWYERDFPVLKAAAELCGESSFNHTMTHSIAQRAQLPQAEVVKAISSLKEKYLHAKNQDSMTSRDYIVTGLTAEGLVAADLWPSPDALQERFVTALEQMIEETPADSPRATKLEGVLAAVRDLSTGTGATVFGTLIAAAAGIS